MKVSSYVDIVAVFRRLSVAFCPIAGVSGANRGTGSLFLRVTEL